MIRIPHDNPPSARGRYSPLQRAAISLFCDIGWGGLGSMQMNRLLTNIGGAG